MNTLSLRRGFNLGTAILLATAVASPAQMTPNFAQAQQQNSRALRAYTWKSRTEIRKGGDIKNVQVSLMRYDSYGALQKSQLSSSPRQELPTRGLRGLIAQKRKENFLETLDRLGALAKSYSELSPETMQRFIANALVTPEPGPHQKLLRIRGENVLQPGDSMTFWVDAMTRKPRRVEVQTALERKPVSIVSDFQDLPNGPTYTSRSVVDFPGEELKVITENFDYQRQEQ